jgi:hypothetical protein
LTSGFHRKTVQPPKKIDHFLFKTQISNFTNKTG